jgi:hypothetical protein
MKSLSQEVGLTDLAALAAQATSVPVPSTVAGGATDNPDALPEAEPGLSPTMPKSFPPPTVEWTPFALRRPADMTHIIWRSKSSATCVGNGYYCEEDADDWGTEGDWIAVTDLQKLAIAK